MLVKDKTIVPGDISSYKIILTTLGGEERDISLAVMKIDLYQDILMPYWTGCLHISDSSNMISTLPIEEGVKIKIQWSTNFEFPSKLKNEKEVKLSVVAYKITDRNHINGFLFNYKIHFCTPEFLKNKTTRISGRIPKMRAGDLKPKSITPGKAIESLVKQELGEEYKVYLLSDSIQSYSIDASNWTLFYTVSFLTKLSIANNVADFMFVKISQNEYAFERLDNLFSNEKYSVGIDLYRKPANTPNTDEFNDLQSIIDFKLHHFDASMNMDGGMEGNKILHFDFTTKRVGFTPTTKKQDDRKKSDLINNENSINSNIIFQPRTSTGGEVGVSDINSAQNYWLGDRRRSLLQLEQDPLIIQMHGQAGMLKWLGKNINVKMPSFQDHVPGKQDEKFDSLYKGKYIITAIHHEVSVERYSVNLKLCKWKFEG